MVANQTTDQDWASRIVDWIDRVVSTIRRYTTQPLVSLARGIVFGLLGAFGLVAAIVLLVLSLVRGLQALLDLAVDREAAVWISYFVIAAVFAAVGAALMRRRFTDDESQ